MRRRARDGVRARAPVSILRDLVEAEVVAQEGEGLGGLRSF